MIDMRDDINISESCKMVEGELYRINNVNGEEVYEFVGKNKVLFGLTQLIGMLYIGRKSTESNYFQTKVRYLEDALNLAVSGSVPLVVPPSSNIHKLFGFGVSLDGGTLGVINNVRKQDKGFNLPTSDDGLVPLKMTIGESSSQAIATMASGYKMRQQRAASGTLLAHSRYYIKAFDNITITNQKATGEALSDYPDTISDVSDIRTVVDMRLTISETDLVDYFSMVQGDASLKYFNSVTLFMGREVNHPLGGGSIDYRNVIASNRINIKQSNYDTVQYVYRIYI
jgi:hypothetical protein